MDSGARRQRLAQLVQQGRVRDAEQLASEGGCVDELVELLSTNRDYRAGFRVALNLGRDPRDYPALVERADKAYIRYCARSMDWRVVEAMLGGRPRLLAYFAEELHFRGMADLALSIVQRGGLDTLPLKAQLAAAAQARFALVPNPVLAWDEFLPLESLTQPGKAFLTLGDLGRAEQSVRLFGAAEDASAAVAALEGLRGARVVGLDTENRPGMYPFEDCAADLLQIAGPDAVYLFALPALAASELWAALSALLSDKAVLKLGFSFKDDLKRIQRALGREGLYVANYIDVCELHASLSACKRTNLSAICQGLLGKPLSKAECLFDWAAQPLRRYQTHYAALDAAVLPALFARLREAHPLDATDFSDSFGAEF